MALFRGTVLLLGCLTVAPTAADQAEVTAALGRFIADPTDEASLSAALGDPAFDREQLSALLHRAARFAPLGPGLEGLRIRVEGGDEREVLLRIPRGYDSARAWPLILAYHPSGGNGRDFLQYVERWLGEAVERFVVAAPSDYRQTGVDAPPPFTGEHAIVLDTLRRRVHVDGDRVYALGYSLGGYTAWTLALLLPDRLAGSVALASTFTVPVGDDGLWEVFLENLRHVPVLHVWGENDRLPVPGIGGGGGTMASLNRTFRRKVRSRELPIRHVELPETGHGDVVPPREALLETLAARRAPFPSRIDHRFRHLHHGRAYWLRALSWRGDSWGADAIDVAARPEENRRHRYGGALIERLGRLEGSIADNRIEVKTRHVGELEICLNDDQIAWNRPVTVMLNGVEAWRGALRPDAGTAVRRAVAGMELDRLVWACLRLGSSSTP